MFIKSVDSGEICLEQIVDLESPQVLVPELLPRHDFTRVRNDVFDQQLLEGLSHRLADVLLFVLGFGHSDYDLAKLVSAQRRVIVVLQVFFFVVDCDEDSIDVSLGQVFVDDAPVVAVANEVEPVDHGIRFHCSDLVNELVFELWVVFLHYFEGLIFVSLVTDELIALHKLGICGKRSAEDLGRVLSPLSEH